MTLAAWSGWFLVLAFMLANLPWCSGRFLVVIDCKTAGKRPWMYMVEWMLLYLCVGGLALGLEYKTTGLVYPKGWEFYSVGFFIFLVFAFPGVVYRHVYIRMTGRARAQS